MGMRFKKTPEQIEAEQVLQAEESPQFADSEFQISPEIKQYGYNLFGMEKATPNEAQVNQELEQETQPEREPAAIEVPEVKQVFTQEVPQQISEKKEKPLPKKVSDIEKMLKKSEEEEDRLMLWKQSAKLRDAIMGAGSGTVIKTDTSMYDEMAQRAQRPMKNLLLKQELEDKQAKSDPNSEVSKLAKESLGKLGMDMSGFDNVSYSQLEKLYPSLSQALYVKIKADADKAQTQAMKEAKAEAKDIRAEEKNKANYYKTQSGIDRMVSQIQKGKPYVGYEQAKQAKALLLEAANSTDVQKKVQNAAGFMNYAKVAQGDDSVVRSEDMKVLAGSMGFTSPSEMLSKIGARAQGSPFSPAELQMMSRVVDTIIRVKKKSLQQQITPLRKRAEANDYDLSESIDPSLLEEIEASDEQVSPVEKLKELDERLKANQARIEELRSRKGN